jgi:uncharacterized protein YerC
MYSRRPAVDQTRVEALLEALIACQNDRDLLRALWRDLTTPQESEAISLRWACARLILEGRKPLIEIAKELPCAPNTVGRVSRTIRHDGAGGYVQVHERLRKERQGDGGDLATEQRVWDARNAPEN